MNIKAAINKIIEYWIANTFWCKLMLQSCMITGIAYVFVQSIVQFTPLISVYIWISVADI